MSSALAIAGVTAVLKDLLDSGMIDHKVTDAMGQGVTVSALAPDEIELGTNQQPRLNLFLYQATPNAAWRNQDFPAYDSRGTRIANPPLALDLHYMLTAYGAADLQAEVLLGYAMLLFHQMPVLARDAIRRSLDPPPSAAVTGSLLPTVYQSLRAADLGEPGRADQDHSGGDEHRGAVEALDRYPVTLSPNRYLSGDGGADPARGVCARGLAGAVARST